MQNGWCVFERHDNGTEQVPTVATKKTTPTGKSTSSLIDELEQTAESVLRHVGELVGQL
ncbi:MAG: hypothetical protein OES09_03550 [Gammaproteobacteria bacterium]|nr:hypothetical protein [Gammaproteobacteria bacterium]